MNPKLIYILLREIWENIVNEEKRQNTIIIIITGISLIFLFFAFIYYILTSPLSAILSATGLDIESEDAILLKDFKNTYSNVVYDDIESITLDYIPYLSQKDERWANESYAGDTIYTSGCGVTSLSMIVAGLTGELNSENSPLAIARYSKQMGWAIDGQGTSWALMTEGASHYGIRGEQVGTSEKDILSSLNQGKPMILSMTSQSKFTNGGHFIVLIGVTEDGNVKVYDPYSTSLSYLEPHFTTHHISEVASPNSKGAWAYSLE